MTLPSPASASAPTLITDRTALGPELLRGYRTDGAAAAPGRALRPPGRQPSAPAWPRARVDQTIARRRAVHEFGDLDLRLDQLDDVVGQALAADRELWPTEVAAGLGVHLVLLAWRVPGLAAGAYAASPDGWSAVPPLPGFAPPVPREFVIQREFAEAPALLLAGGDLGAGLRRHGLHGHRLLAVRAAAALHTAWLATVAGGGYGCFFGGVVDEAVRRYAGADGDRRSLVVGLALGFPPVGA